MYLCEIVDAEFLPMEIDTHFSLHSLNHDLVLYVVISK